MSRFGRRYGWWLIALAAFVLIGGLRATRPAPAARERGGGRTRPLLMREVRSDIVIVGIDAASLAALDKWPWPRRHHAKLLERARARRAGQRVPGHRFQLAVERPRRRAARSGAGEAAGLPGLLPIYFQNASGTDESLIVSKPLRRFARRTERVVVNGEAGPDGLTRDWRNFWIVDGSRLRSVIDPRRVLPDERDVPIDFSISPASLTYVSYVDVMEGRVPRAALAGKTIFVGATAVELGDMLAVPVHRSLPGIVVQALATESVTQGAPRTDARRGCGSRRLRCGPRSRR